jgi:ubiquinone/menaquinone biosynthesis C-methylase UbiE
MKAHSAEYINDNRLTWWNPDFVGLLKERIGFSDIKTIADCGVGGGHWSAVLFQAESVSRQIVGFDSDPYWVEASTRYFSQSRLDIHSYLAVRSDVQSLDWQDDYFDLITCQTVLMHTCAPDQAVREMVRVLRPGGIIMVVEPLNLLNRVAFEQASRWLLPEELGELVSWWSKYKQHLFNHSGNDHEIAVRLPGLLANAGVIEIEMYQNDRVFVSDSSSFSTKELGAELDIDRVAQMLDATEFQQNKSRILELYLKVESAVRGAGEPVVTALNTFIAIGKKPI